ncbi:hypothetical protein DIPPA_30081 [Diplonema papillatum]|nr:hypothetical protein DIPPA_30081 [Diplonema papillatum]
MHRGVNPEGYGGLPITAPGAAGLAPRWTYREAAGRGYPGGSQLRSRCLVGSALALGGTPSSPFTGGSPAPGSPGLGADLLEQQGTANAVATGSRFSLGEASPALAPRPGSFCSLVSTREPLAGSLPPSRDFPRHTPAKAFAVRSDVSPSASSREPSVGNGGPSLRDVPSHFLAATLQVAGDGGSPSASFRSSIGGTPSPSKGFSPSTPAGSRKAEPAAALRFDFSPAPSPCRKLSSSGASSCSFPAYVPAAAVRASSEASPAAGLHSADNPRQLYADGTSPSSSSRPAARFGCVSPGPCRKFSSSGTSSASVPGTAAPEASPTAGLHSADDPRQLYVEGMFPSSSSRQATHFDCVSPGVAGAVDSSVYAGKPQVPFDLVSAFSRLAAKTHEEETPAGGPAPAPVAAGYRGKYSLLRLGASHRPFSSKSLLEETLMQDLTIPIADSCAPSENSSEFDTCLPFG